MLQEAAIHRTLAQKKKLTKEATHDSWFEAIAEHLGDSFEVLATNNLWAIRMVVFVRKVYVPHITQVEQAKVATGIGGVAGNKGGVGVSFRLLDSSICLVNSHLAAHQDKIKERYSIFPIRTKLTEGIQQPRLLPHQQAS